jgi:hypothetical protein
MANTNNDFSNSGVLFKNDRKEKDSQPDYRGDANVVCPLCETRTEYWLSSWLKQGKKGRFLSLAFQLKDKAKPAAQPAPAAAPNNDDDIPF